MKTLALTSPPIRGQAVEVAQAALKRGNIFNADFLQGPQDNVFGEGTARACIRAKYWCGYSTASMLPIYGDQLHGYLTGTKALGPIMKIRRNRRLEDAQKVPARVRALNLARSELGTVEVPRGSNRQKFGEWYGMNGVPWCAIFVSWCFSHAYPARPLRYAYCPYVVNDARAGKNGLQVVSYADAQPGDLVLYNWDGDWDADHIGLLEKKEAAPGKFYSIEGNTAVGNDSNGGEVMRRYRNIAQVQCIVRVSG